VSGAVQKFIDRKWPEVQRQIVSWRSRNVSGNDILAFVLTLCKEWEGIPLEEKQIPYLTLERTFWASVHTLHISAANAVPGAVLNETGKPRETFKPGLDERLDTVYSYLRDRLPIPEGSFIGRRHLP
jgi:hypothetical protein